MEKNEFFSYSWCIDKKELDKTKIRIYGLNKQNENVCIRVENFTPYVYVELPDSVSWNDARAQTVKSKIDYLLKNTRTGEDFRPLRACLVYKEKLYYADMEKTKKRKKYPFLFLNFNHHNDIQQLGKKLRYPLMLSEIGKVKLKIHENNATPILQLTSLKKLPTAGWIEFTGKKVDKKETVCKHEYIVKWKNLFPKDSDEVARPLIMGYDIEVYSSIPSAMPKPEREPDKVFQISCVFARQNAPESTYEKYLLTLGEVDQFRLEEGTIVRTFESEFLLFKGYVDLIQERQPNLIIGYNIFGFDIPYMIDRSEGSAGCSNILNRQGCIIGVPDEEKIIKWSSSAYKNQEFRFLDAEGRIFVDLLPLIKRDYKLSNYRLKTVSAHFLKGQTKDPLDAKGIFRCYELGVLEAKGTRKGRKAISICGKYCVKDSALVVKLFETLTSWVALCEMSKVTNVPIFDLYTRGQQLKVFSQVYKNCTHDNIVVEREGYITGENEHYIGATVFPPVPGVYDKVVPFDFASLYPTTIIAYNISWDTLVPLDSDIPLEDTYNMSWTEHHGCAHDPNIIRKQKLIKMIKEADDEMRALRKERDENKRDKDRYSRYMDKINKIKEDIKPLRDERSELQKKKAKHIMCGERKFRWMKRPMGVLPTLLTKLLDTRKMTKKLMKEEGKKLKGLDMKDPSYDGIKTYIEVLDKRQLALKVSANSMYGSLGVQKGYLPLMPGAMCTTFKGREAVQLAADTIQEKHGGILIYGDTDSNYIAFPFLKTAQECWDYSVKVADEVSKLYPSPMKLEFEEAIYWRFFIITKKRYMSLACKKDGNIEKNKDGTDKISKKGVLLQRRDNCNFIRLVYADVIIRIFGREDRDDILYEILQKINKLCSRYYSYSDFTITKAVGDIDMLRLTPGVDDKGKDCVKIGDYKVKTYLTPENRDGKFKKYKIDTICTCRNQDHERGGIPCDSCKEYYLQTLPAQVQLAERMRNRGQLVANGSRIEYVITTNGGHTAKQYIKVESSEYFERHSRTLELDFMYYLKQLSKPLDQILNIMYNKDTGHKYKFTRDFVYEQYKYRRIREKMLQEFKDLFKPEIRFIK